MFPVQTFKNQDLPKKQFTVVFLSFLSFEGETRESNNQGGVEREESDSRKDGRTAQQPKGMYWFCKWRANAHQSNCQQPGPVSAHTLSVPHYLIESSPAAGFSPRYLRPIANKQQKIWIWQELDTVIPVGEIRVLPHALFLLLPSSL